MYRLTAPLVRKRPRVALPPEEARRALSRNALVAKEAPEDEVSSASTSAGWEDVDRGGSSQMIETVVARRAVSTAAAAADDLRTSLFDGLLKKLPESAQRSQLTVTPAMLPTDGGSGISIVAGEPPAEPPGVNPPENPVTLIDKQVLLEERSVQDAVERYNSQLKGAILRGDVGELRLVQRLILSWYPAVSQNLARIQKQARDGDLTPQKKDPAISVLHMVDPNTLAVVAIHEALAGCLSRNMDDRKKASFTRLAQRLGAAVRAEIDYRNLAELRKAHNRRKDAAKTSEIERNLTSTREFRKENRLIESLFSNAKPSLALINSVAKRSNLARETWDSALVVQVGAYLINSVLEECRVQVRDDGFVQPCDDRDAPTSVAAFNHEYFWENGKKIGEVRVNAGIGNALLQSDEILADIIPPRHRPMLVTPKPWVSLHEGGYLRSRVCVLKQEPEPRHLNELAMANMAPVYHGLNVLGSQAWKVNSSVLNAVERLWKQGGGIAGLVERSDNHVEKVGKFTATSEDPTSRHEEFSNFLAKRRQARNLAKENRERNSLRWDTKYRIDQANEFAEKDRIYLPHSLDFRGRAYPIPAHLQHMGSDLCRGMLTFAGPGRRLGERGVFWLKIHLANLLGFDKLDFNSRISAVENSIGKAISTARDPFSEASLEFWTTQEDPFQVLAACHEFEEASRLASPGVTIEDAMVDFESNLPIQVDGSCNGLQHYAALGRDVEGGRQVNLLRSEKPMDVYSGVADRVRAKVELDAKAGNSPALLLQGKISRKVVKQTVMTSVYGVTRTGAREQIQNRLKELGCFSDDDLWKCAYYLSKVTLSSLGDLFLGATRTMDWLAICAQNIARVDEPVQWTTPLGLPVTQAYRLTEQNLIRSVVQRVALLRPKAGNPVAKGRQRSAFPPNYIHSLDSSHMLMTATRCADAGLNFASVHDSFWTNAADVDIMNTILREEFVNLHSRNLLHDLMTHFRARYGHLGVDIPDLPDRGELDLTKVLESEYFFD